ncbi:MAG: hypothetical protein HPY83_08540 [Anaerolineae bacterium]|nr:hypothetical protein [Anaerolineae bacterium]
MTGKERVLKALAGEKTDVVPAFPHWWGVYKLDILGLDPRLFPTLGGPRLAEIDANFYQTFKPDIIHLGGGASRDVRDRPVVQEGQDLYLLNPDTGERNRLLPNWTVDWGRRKARRIGLTSKAEVDDYVAGHYPTKDQILESGTYDHVVEILRRFGDEAFVAMNLGSPVCTTFDPDGPLGYTEALIALVEKPALMEYLIGRSYEGYLEQAKALAAIGCHALMSSEAYVAADTVSPDMFGSLIYPIYKDFNRRVADFGIIPFIYFMGNIGPLVPYLKDVNIKALMVEEPKKGFNVDVVEIKRQVGDSLCLVGNVDSVEVMLRGRPADVEQAVRAQLPAAKNGGFIMSTGSPLTVDTPVENVHTFMRAARGPVP